MTSTTTAAEQIVREFWRLMASNDFFSVGALLTDDFVLEWPQSDERIRGRDRFALMNADYPSNGRWFFVVNRIVAGESEAVSDVSITDGVQNARAISFFTIVGGRIARLVEYWPEPYPAPENRKHLVERIVALFPILLLASALLVAGAPAHADTGPPSWAFPINPPDFKPPVDDGSLRHVPDSDRAFTLGQVRDLFSTPDWHPDDHPPMPEIVSSGRKPEVQACGFCHRADGPGGPENARLAGLPAQYIVQQMADFKSGARNNSSSQRLPTAMMISLSKAITPAEVDAAAAYFSALKPRPVMRVIETAMVPKTAVTGWHLAIIGSGGEEPLGGRIIEVPQDLQQFVSRDARSHFIAYVPVGSIEAGKQLATTGGDGRTVACGGCHGADLKGLGMIPGIAGRSPSYVVRQLYDFKHGARAGVASAAMVPTVAKLTMDDMISLAAFAASLPP